MSDQEIRATIAAIEKTAERVIKRVGFAIQGELIRATPVDTGWARANWLVSIGRPPEGPVGSREAVNAGAQAAGQGRLLVYNVSQGDVWIGNNVPYIQKLNEGHSKQAPANFVERAISQGIASIAGAVRS